MNLQTQCVAFEGTRRIASGELRQVASTIQKSGSTSAIIFNDTTSEVIDFDPTLSPKELTRQLESRELKEATPATDEPRAPGRPRLGVVAREVTLLPRHWEWLNLQPGGASVALRKLVDEARKVNGDTDRKRLATEAAYKFMSVMAGNATGFEEAIRGLFAGDAARFALHSQTWPPDVREHAAKLAARVFERNESTQS